MELLHWSELAGLVVVAQVVFPRCSTAADLLSPALLMLHKLWPESLFRPLGERSLCYAPPSPGLTWLEHEAPLPR